MIGRVQHIRRVLLGRNHAGRDLTVFPDDVFLVSYPRSGNTWTRFLIANLIYPDDPVTFANVESRIPEIYLFRDVDLRRLSRPRILKSHEYFDHRYKQIIYIVRDPRDVAVSLYHYAIKRKQIPDTYPIEQFVPRFISGEFFVDWSTWEDHVSSWRTTRQNKAGFLLLRYEDMLRNPTRELGKIVGFLKLKVTPQRLARAVALSSADRMRELEKMQSGDWRLTKGTRQDKPFIRHAEEGSWRSDLPSQSVSAIESAWGPLMQSLGYELSLTPPSVAGEPVLSSADNK